MLYSAGLIQQNQRPSYLIILYKQCQTIYRLRQVWRYVGPVVNNKVNNTEGI